MYKNILCLISSCERKILQILKKNGYKIDTISPDVNLDTLKNLVYKKNYEIFLTSGYIEQHKRTEIHQFMFNNFPLMFFATIIYDIKQSCSIQSCPILKKNMCENIFINYNNTKTFINIFNQTIKKHIDTLYGKLLLNVLDIIKKVIPKYEKYLYLKNAHHLSHNTNVEYIDTFIKYTFDIIKEKIVSLFCADKVSVFIYNTSSEKYELISSYGFNLNTEPKPIIIKNNWKIINYVINTKKAILIQNGLSKHTELKKKRITTNQNISSSMVIPITFGETVLGIICISRTLPNKRLFLNQEFFMAKQFAQWISYVYSTIVGNKMVLEYERMKSDFISIINHELRTPLMAISSATELVEKILSPEIYLLIRRNIQKLNSLVEQLLDFSRIEHGTFSIIKTKNSVSELIKEIVSEYNLTLKNINIKLQIDLNLKKDVQYFDKERIKQVITNLINNSIKFIPQEKVFKYIKLSIEETKKELVFCITDNGIGIHKKDLKNIFNPFVQLTENIYANNKIGIGLGLAISKNIVESHSGKIWAESIFGKWTKIFFTIPKTKQI